MFVDRAKIFIRSGKGGNGAVSFRREPFVPEGGPDGGDGGKGGDVIFEADENMRTLMDFRYKRKYEAENGQDGMKKKRYGKNGEDLIIKVPVGTVVIDEESGLVMKDLKKHGESFVAAKGGKGGKGNTKYATSTRQAPNFAEAGGFAKERNVILEMKLIADVGLVGFPNVGKSTLLSVTSNARPKIANYHFTTIDPNLGVVKIYDTSFVMADIAGIIEGASEGAGLGHRFLKHIERTKVLIHVVDVSGSEGRDPKEDFDKINKELEQYSEKLLKKPQIVAANKIDLIGEDSEEYQDFKAYVEEQLAAGKDVILEIEVQGALKVKEKNPQALLLFVTPPSAEELKHRLIDRGTETMDVINDRMRRAAEESEIMDHYQYLVINDDLDTCVKEVHQLIQSEHLKVSENLDLVADIQKELKEMKGE